MSSARPVCPSCSDPLVLTHKGDFDSWVCPNGHGLAATLDETYDNLQEDEIGRLWLLARAAVASNDSRRCPICERAMVSVDVPYDLDEAAEGAEGDTADVGDVWVDVCVEDQLIWFDSGELQVFPVDLPDAEPTAEELESVERIRAAFGQQYAEGVKERESHELTERIYRRVARHAGLTTLLTEVCSLGRADTSGGAPGRSADVS